MSEVQLSSSENRDVVTEQAKKESAKPKKAKPVQKKKDDAYLLLAPDKVKSLAAKIANRVIEILKEEPLLSEKELILKLIARDQEIKEYFVRTQDISYIKYVIRNLAERKLILKARILGENKRVYFFLPEQLQQFKDKIIKAPG